MLGFSNRQLLLLSLAVNVVLLLVTLHGSYDITTISSAELETWSRHAQDKLSEAAHAGYGHRIQTPADTAVADTQAQLEADAQMEEEQQEERVRIEVVKERAPQCNMCTAAPELCEELGKERLSKALSYAGSNSRLRRVLKKMRSGEPWVLGVIGGSVSRGHGIAHGNLNDRPFVNAHRIPNMHRLVFDHLDTLFPSRDPQVAESLTWAEGQKEANPKWKHSLVDIASEEGKLSHNLTKIKRPISRAYGFSGRELGVNSFVNGAQGATGSDYFAYCFAEHVPEDVDLVLVELGINDERQLKTFDNYELMIRGLLDLPGKPAIIYVEIFQLMFATMSYGADIHRGINEYYDIPSVSLRNPYLPLALANTSRVPEMFLADKDYHGGKHDGTDLRHLSNEYHKRTAQLVNAFIDSQLCEMDNDGNVEYQEEPMPRQTMSSQYDLEAVMPMVRPQCFSTTSPLHKLVPSDTEGWEEWAWKEKKYFVAKKPGSRIEFPISTALGTVQLIYQRSYAYGLGKARCGLIGVRSTDTMLDGYWEMPYNILQTHSFKNVPPGNYTLKCVIQPQTSDPNGGTEFRIASITRVAIDRCNGLTDSM